MKNQLIIFNLTHVSLDYQDLKSLKTTMINLPSYTYTINREHRLCMLIFKVRPYDLILLSLLCKRRKSDNIGIFYILYLSTERTLYYVLPPIIMCFVARGVCAEKHFPLLDLKQSGVDKSRYQNSVV